MVDVDNSALVSELRSLGTPVARSSTWMPTRGDMACLVVDRKRSHVETSGFSLVTDPMVAMQFPACTSLTVSVSTRKDRNPNITEEGSTNADRYRVSISQFKTALTAVLPFLRRLELHVYRGPVPCLWELCSPSIETIYLHARGSSLMDENWQSLGVSVYKECIALAPRLRRLTVMHNGFATCVTDDLVDAIDRGEDRVVDIILSNSEILTRVLSSHYCGKNIASSKYLQHLPIAVLMRAIGQCNGESDEFVCAALVRELLSSQRRRDLATMYPRVVVSPGTDLRSHESINELAALLVHCAMWSECPVMECPGFRDYTEGWSSAFGDLIKVMQVPIICMIASYAPNDLVERDRSRIVKVSPWYHHSLASILTFAARSTVEVDDVVMYACMRSAAVIGAERMWGQPVAIWDSDVDSGVIAAYKAYSSVKIAAVSKVHGFTVE